MSWSVALCAACQASPVSNSSRACSRYSWPRGPSATRLMSSPSCCTRNGRRRRDHPGAGAAGDLDAALLLQHEQRLAHGRPADAEARHQLLLGRQMGADLELVGGDHRLELLRDVVGALAPADRQLAERRARGHGITRRRALHGSGLGSRAATSCRARSPHSQPSVAPGAPCPDGADHSRSHGPKCQ